MNFAFIISEHAPNEELAALVVATAKEYTEDPTAENWEAFSASCCLVATKRALKAVGGAKAAEEEIRKRDEAVAFYERLKL